MSLKEELVLEAEELGQMHGDTNTSQSSAIRGRKRSAVWKDFEEVTLKSGTVKVQCKYCKFQYSKQADGSTTTLKKHLTRCLKKVRSQTLGQQTLVFTHYAVDPLQDQRAMSDAIEGKYSREVGGQLISVEKAQLKEGSYGDGNYGKRCYNCGEPGHLARDCNNSGECYMGDRLAVHSSCINCGEPGHLAQDCYCSSKRCIDDRSGGSSHGNKDQVDNGDSSIAASVSLPILPKIEDIFNEARRKAMKTMVDSIRLASGKSLADLPADLEKTFLLLEKLEVPTEDLRRDINKLVSGAKQIENLKHETAALAETREKRIQEAKEKASNARKEHKNSLGALKKLQCTLDNKVGYHSELKKDIAVIKGCLSKLEAKEQDLIDEVAEVEAAVAKGSQKAKETATAESEAEAAMDKIVQMGIDEESRTQRELIERLEKCLSHTKANFVTRYGSE